MRRLVVVALLLALFSGQAAWALAPTDNGLPFDEAGQKAYNSGKSVWVPLFVFFILFGLAGAFAFGVQRLAGVAVRSAIAIGILAVACGSLGLTVLFPGLVTALVL